MWSTTASPDHIVGCPLDCAYCIRHTYGLWDQRQPRALMTDVEADWDASLACPLRLAYSDRYNGFSNRLSPRRARRRDPIVSFDAE